MIHGGDHRLIISVVVEPGGGNNSQENRGPAINVEFI